MSFFFLKKCSALSAALIFTLSAAFGFCVHANADGAALEDNSSNLIRVGINYSQTAHDSVQISGDGGFLIQVQGYDEDAAAIDVNTLSLTVENNTLVASTAFGATVAAAETGIKISVNPADYDSITQINSVEYRGSFEFYLDTNNKITVINVLDIEQYLRGVLPSEVYPSWNMEALKAAAVAARTYALRSAAASSHSSSGFDVCSTTHCQMYSGVSKEYPTTDQAVLETAGLVVKYNGQLAITPYHSSNGGYTESSSGAWGSDQSAYPYLVSVFTPYEDYRGVPNGKWETVIKPDELTDYIPDSYASKLSGKITDIDFDRAPSGFNHSMTVTDENGNTLTVSTSSAVRSFFGSLVISPNFAIARTYVASDEAATPAISVISADGTYDLTGVNGYTYISADGTGTFSGVEEVLVFDGQGYGHGVGLSQFGSRCMADAGFTYTQILELYFPGTVVESLYPAVADDIPEQSQENGNAASESDVGTEENSADNSEENSSV